jgi:hypothetical protein
MFTSLHIADRIIRTHRHLSSCVSLPRCGEGLRVGGAAHSVPAGATIEH